MLPRKEDNLRRSVYGRVNPTEYIALDLEWNQPGCVSALRERNEVALHGEIIQIGAVKMNNRFEITDTLEINVRPEIYKNITKRIETITGINTDAARQGIPMAQAMEKLKVWCGRRFTFLTWGSDDIKVLRDNLKFFGMTEKWLPEKNYDLQIIFDYLNTHEGRQFSLDFAIEFYGIAEDRKRHNAFNDAFYTALVCGRMKPFKCIENYKRVIIEKLLHENNGPAQAGLTRKVQVFESLNVMKNLKKVCGERVTCPECNKKAVLLNRYRQSELNYTLMYGCSEHGYFVSTLKMRPIESFKVTRVVRSTYKPGNAENMKMGLKVKKWRAI